MIGVLGSGIGGLTVVRELIKQLPEYDLIYLGDTARAPYGDKSPETVTRWALRNTGFLLDKGATLLVTACNTISSIASETVSKRYDLPVFEVITPGVERALSYSKKLMIGVIGTRTTIESDIYEEKIKQMSPEAKVYSMACPLLVPLVEEGWIKKPETTMIIKKYLHPLKAKQVDTLILGSTHYVRIKKIIQVKIGKRVNIVDTSEPVAAKVEGFLKDNKETERNLGKNGRYRFFVSDLTERDQKLAASIVKRNILLEKGENYHLYPHVLSEIQLIIG